MPFMQLQIAALQFVADKEIADDIMNLISVHHKESAPPFFKVEIAFLLCVHLRIHIILLCPVCIGRIQKLHVQNQIRAVKHAIAQIAEK